MLKNINLTGLADNITSMLKNVNLTAIADNVTSALKKVNVTALANNVSDWLTNATDSLKKAVLTRLFDAANALFDTVQNLTQKAADLRDNINLTALYDNVTS